MMDGFMSMDFGLSPAGPTAPNLGLGGGGFGSGGMSGWASMPGVDELERLRRLREAAMAQGINPAAMDAHMVAQTGAPGGPPLPFYGPPAPQAPVPGQGRPPAPVAAPAAPPAPQTPYGPPMPSPDALQAAKLEGRSMWDRAGDWMARNFSGGSGGQGGQQALAAAGGAGARLMAPPPQAQTQLAPMQTPGNRPQARGSLPIKPGPLDRQRAAAVQRRRGILDE